ncbi:TPA: peptidylprolyl isomerase [Candidatus Micrarchaeota archaeon]|nr:peptidylprolyl isomerase [Candidatus Micrarchaeota archaeon]
MQVKASHILVSSLNEANSVLSELHGGKSFEELAKKYSSCPSGRDGGNLGFFGKGQMVGEFETAAFSLDIGQVSGPIKTQFGYHLIKVTGKK